MTIANPTKTNTRKISAAAVLSIQNTAKREREREREKGNSPNSGIGVATQTKNVYSEHNKNNNNDSPFSSLIFDRKIRLATEGLEGRYNNLLASKMLTENACRRCEYYLIVNMTSSSSDRHMRGYNLNLRCFL
jgi:hypothetical protein